MNTVETAYYDLLKEWLDSLLELIVRYKKHIALDGAILCPACSVIHGRCADAIYPFMCMAELSGENKYLEAARGLFRWHKYMICDDSSVYNDSQSQWSGVTVFAAISLCDALKYHGGLLKSEEKSEWEKRLRGFAWWIGENITPGRKTNINYIAAGAAALAKVGAYFGDDKAMALADRLAEAALEHVSENKLIYGEGSLLRNATRRGMCAVDVGYNSEETLPCLYDYACEARNEGLKEKVKELAAAQLEMMLPDGAWDNSFGTRNFKWTYWGSRTSDGCQGLFNALGKTDSVFAAAAYRNLTLYRRCTDGLLYGGPHYKRHFEEPCVHHSFCHAKALARALDDGIAEDVDAALPSDNPPPLKKYEEIGVYRLSAGDWRASVCFGDFEYMKGGHASGGAVTLLWHKDYGAVIATANTDYSLHEAHNQQLTRRKRLQGSLCPMLACEIDGKLYSQVYDYESAVEAIEKEGSTEISVKGTLCDISHEAPELPSGFDIKYELSEKGLKIRSRCENKEHRFVIPIVFKDEKSIFMSSSGIRISDKVFLNTVSKIVYTGEVFNLAPGFEAANIMLIPDENGEIEAEITYGF